MGTTATRVHAGEKPATASPAQRHAGVRPFAAPVPAMEERGGERNAAALPGFSFGKLAIQPKLAVGPPGDALEVEADEVADRVMRMPDPAAAGVLQRKCSGCAEENTVQRKAAGDSIAGMEVPPIVHDVLRSPGQPLDAASRAYMEPRFGQDFGHVRVHTDARAAASSAALQARAYTFGSDIVFGAGEYGTTSGAQRLLAHELSHTLQQGGAPGVRRHAASPLIQRAEYATYVSTVSDDVGKPYLEAAADFYRTWHSGTPVKRVSQMEDVVADLARAKAHIDTFRIVAHFFNGGLEIGSYKEAQTTSFGATEEALRSPKEFRARVADARVLSDGAFNDRITALQNDPRTGKHMQALGVGQGSVSYTEPIGIALRALLDAHFVSTLRLPGGAAPKIPGRAALDAFAAQRLRAYGPLAVQSLPKGQQAAAAAALQALPALIDAALTGAGVSNEMDQGDIDTIANPTLDPSGNKESPQLARDVSEGAGGTYTNNLDKVRSHVDAKTHIEIRGCNAGAEPDFLEGMRHLFGDGVNLPSISAPDLYQYFYHLGYQSYTAAPADRAKLKQSWTAKAIDKEYDLDTRVHRGEVLPTVNEPNLARVADVYKLSLPRLVALNPELVKRNPLPPNTPVWLVARPPVEVKKAESVADFCTEVLGDASLAPLIRAYNSDKLNIWEKAKAPDKPDLQPGDKLWLVPEELAPAKGNIWEKAKQPQAPPPAPTPLRDKVAEPDRTEADFEADLAAGNAFVGIDPSGQAPVPRAELDDAHRSTAIAAWLTAQKYDPNNGSAAALSKKYQGGQFQAAMTSTVVEFLAESYPLSAAKVAIFPDDPRYAPHIKRVP